MTVARHRRWTCVLGLLFGAAALLGSVGTRAGPSNPEEDPPPTWRFRKADRPVKVVVLAGSIGAWPKQPYAERLEQMCANIEVRNLSMTGYGAWALKKRFRQQVLDNPRVDLRADDSEYWLVFQGGLNSVATPEQTNRYLRDVFLMAHAHGIQVVGLSLTPWGDDEDRRWRGASGLAYWRHTKAVVDFVVGRSSPSVALGRHAARRPDPEAPWDPAELADVGIDLYESPLRDESAPTRDMHAMKLMLERDGTWQSRHARLTPDQRAQALESDAVIAASLPRWYLRPELRSFDHIHPNAQGHRIIAQTMCPRLPASWGCSCPDADASTSDDSVPTPSSAE